MKRASVKETAVVRLPIVQVMNLIRAGIIRADQVIEQKPTKPA